LVQAVAADIQPVTNLRILKYVGDEKKAEWAKHFLAEGFKGSSVNHQPTKPLMRKFKNVASAVWFCFGGCVGAWV
jgi:hypothetical protein